jgi:hypothetical protein
MPSARPLIVLFVLILCRFIPACAATTGELTGQIVEKETMIPIAYATVVIENGKESYRFDANEYGYYTAKHIPSGHYQMHIVFNNRTFVMSRVKVADSQSSRVDFVVSSSNDLPATVEVITKTRDKSAEARNAKSSKNAPATTSTNTSESALLQPSADVRDGKVYVVNTDQVGYFLNRETVAAPPVAEGNW